MNFPTCDSLRPDGTRCQNVATSTGKCPACFRRSSKGDHRYGLAPEYHITYDEFRKNRSDFDAKEEITLLRVTLLRLVEGIEQRSETNFLNFVADVYNEIFQMLRVSMKFDEEQATNWASAFTSPFRRAFTSHIGSLSGIGHKESKSISDLVSKITKAMELQKRMEEGFVATVEIDEKLIRYLFTHVVYPPLPPEMRKLVAENARNFSYGKIQGIKFDEDEAPEAEYEFTPEEDEPEPVTETAMVLRLPDL